MIRLLINNIFIVITIFEVLIIEAMCDIQQIKFPYKGRNYNFSLIELKGKAFKDVPIWTIESTSTGELSYNYEGIVQSDGVTYEDATMKAVVFKKNNCNENCWEGIFGLGTKKRIIFTPPVVVDDSNFFDNYSGIYKSHPVDESTRKVRKSTKMSRVTANDVLIVKLLVMIDSSLFKKLKSDVEYVSRYMRIFWSSVDLHYRNLTMPKIELEVTGLAISKDDKASSYVSEASQDGTSVNIDDVLINMTKGEDLIKNTNLTNYNAIVSMIGMSGYVETGGPETIVGSNGVAYNASVCDEKRHYSVIVDDGNYFGVYNTAHEIGHLFGLDHDSLPGNSKDCRPKGRLAIFVMWPYLVERAIVQWSDCSLTSLKIFAENNTLSWCLRSDHQKQGNTNDESIEVDKI